MMSSGKELAQHGFRAGIIALWLVGFGISLAAQSPHPALHQVPPNQSAPSPPSTKEDPLERLLHEARDAIDKMDFAAAIDPLQEYIAKRPEDAYAHFQLGYAYAGLKRDEDAKTEFARAIALDPKMAAGHLNLGLVQMDSDPAAAADSFRHASELQPTESRPHFLAGYALERSGKLQGAVEQYRATLALSPKDYEAHFALGRVLLRTNAPAEAAAQFQDAIEVRGDSAPARLGLAEALLTQKKYGEASNAFAEYLKLKPQDQSARFDLASALLDSGRLEDALQELDQASTAASPSADILKMRGEIYMKQEKWKEAEAALKQALALAPQVSDLAEVLGRAEIRLRDYPAAISILTEVHNRNPQSADALRDLADALFLHEDYASALGALDLLANLEPPQPGSWFVRAICYDKLSRKEEAIGAYQKFLDLDAGQHDSQDLQARHRMLALQKELGQARKK